MGVVGIFDPLKQYQLVRAYVVRNPGTDASEKEICEWMEGQSAATAHLTAGVEFVDELPRNSVRRENAKGKEFMLMRPDGKAIKTRATKESGIREMKLSLLRTCTHLPYLF